MKQSKAILLSLLATVVTATAAPRFAVVRVKEIYANLPSTRILQEQIETERGAIMGNERAVQLRKTIEELQGLQKQLSDKTNPLDEATSRKLARAYEIKRQEALTLQQEFEEYKTEQDKIINRKLVSGMRASLDRIMKASTQVAKDQGFDTVFDSSGDTNTGVAFILVSKDAPDLTSKIQAILKESEPALPPAKPDSAAGKTAPKPGPKAAPGQIPPANPAGATENSPVDDPSKHID